MNNIREKSIKGFKWDFGGLIVSQFVTFAISVILARLLSPSDYGLVAMAGVFVFIFNIFIDVGFSSALIQRNDNTSLTYSSVFYVNIAVSLLVLLIIFLIAPYIGEFYRNNQVTHLVRILAFLLPLGALTNVQNTILNKELKFSFITKRNIVSQVFGGIVGISTAFMGYGVYALIFSSFASQIISMILVWSVSGWKPDFRFSLNEVKKIFNYSFYIFLTTFTGNIFNQLNSLFIGKIFSAATLGYYNVAVGIRDRLSTITSSSTKKVLFPVMSSVKDDHLIFVSVYDKAINVVSFFSFFIVGVFYFWSDFIISFFYGDKWSLSIPILRILTLVAIFGPIGSLMVDALLSKGFAKQNFRLDIIKKINAVIVIIIGYFFGFYAMLYAFLLQAFINMAMNIIFIRKYLLFSVTSISINLLLSSVIIGLVIVFSNVIFIANFFVKGCVFSFLFIIIYMAYQYRFRRDYVEYIFGIIRSLLKK